MRLYHINEAEDSLHHVRSAVGVDAESWNNVYRMIYRWRLELADIYGISPERELSAGKLLSRLGNPATDGEYRHLTQDEAREIFFNGLRVVEEVARTVRGLEIINVCLDRQRVSQYGQVGLNRLLNRINTSARKARRRAFLIFPRGDEGVVSRGYRRLTVFNPVPSRYRLWEEGERLRNMPVEWIIGGPAFRNPESDLLLQMAGFVAHALLEQESCSSTGGQRLDTHRAFSLLHLALNRRASQQDARGIVRR